MTDSDELSLAELSAIVRAQIASIEALTASLDAVSGLALALQQGKATNGSEQSFLQVRTSHARVERSGSDADFLDTVKFVW
ncbi:hypothetical protein [Bosea sp. PAMC 26642]|uniref:hypothetical protein n=1 Tax=Bosea sp. (strain PAMC 26642) TaxID=1792307 RepID=UPI0007704E87|nr:hypothetical protein [Bosea sp. PAMC 26642]AMJ61056.1 hypothetical protein AXW83_12830 [Bosea sp. PAMC 26642]